MFHTLLVRWTGEEDFKLKDGQVELGIDILRGEHDLMVTAPVGWGKTFMMVLPALAHDKLVIIISPFRSLTNLLPLRAEQSGLPTFTLPLDPNVTIASLRKGLVVIPFEALIVPSVLETLTSIFRMGRVASIAIDEAHVPIQARSYRQTMFSSMAMIRQGAVPIHLYSGTLPPAVKAELATGIGTSLRKVTQHDLSARRLNIQLDVIKLPPLKFGQTAEDQRRQCIIEQLSDVEFKYDDAIVFVNTRVEAESLPAQLDERWSHLEPEGYKGAAGHWSVSEGAEGGTKAAAVQKTLRMWEEGSLSVLVTTKGGKQVLDNPSAALAIAFDGTESVMDAGQALGRIGRDGSSARFIVAVPARESGFPPDKDDPKWTLPTSPRDCVMKSLETALGVVDPPRCQDLVGQAALCSGCRASLGSASWENPIPKDLSNTSNTSGTSAPPLVDRLSSAMVESLIPSGRPDQSIVISSNRAVASKLKYDRAVTRLVSLVAQVEDETCVKCFHSRITQYLTRSPKPRNHQPGESCDEVKFGCQFDCRGPDQHRSNQKCKFRIQHSTFNNMCTWCFLPVYAHPLGPTGGLGVDCPLSAKNSVLALTFHVQETSTLLAACNNFGLMLSAEWDRKQTARWLGTMSAGSLPFTNGTLMYLWFDRYKNSLS